MERGKMTVEENKKKRERGGQEGRKANERVPQRRGKQPTARNKPKIQQTSGKGKKIVDHSRRGATVRARCSHQAVTQESEQPLRRAPVRLDDTGTPAMRCLPMCMACDTWRGGNNAPRTCL